MAAAKTTKVALKLPQGLTISHAGQSVTLAGSASAGAVAGFGVTEVDADWFGAWKDKVGKDFAPLAANVLFDFTGKDVAAAAKERTGVANGFEGMDMNKPMVGVEPTEAQKAENAKAVSAAQEAADKAGKGAAAPVQPAPLAS